VKYKENVPLCIRQLQTGMRKTSNSRTGGVYSNGLFLKGAGLSMEDAVAFFQNHFALVTGDTFTEQY
jgi:DNA primase large subunit